jgi:mRNA turnover protein 4
VYYHRRFPGAAGLELVNEQTTCDCANVGKLQTSMGRSKSKRERTVALTATRKRVVGREAKQSLLNDMRNLVDTFERIFIFSTVNMRNVKLKELRSEWRDSRFYFGRKRIAQVAFGRSEGEEHSEGLHLLASRLVGDVGLLFTNRGAGAVKAYFDEYEATDFARSGFVATEAIHLAAGPLEMFVPEFEPRLRALGLNVTLVRSVVTLRENFCVCETGDVLTPERAKLIEYLGIKMAPFRLRLLCEYSKGSGFVDLQ